MGEKKIFSVDIGERWDELTRVLTLAGKEYSGCKNSKPIIDLQALLAPTGGHIDGTVIIEKMFGKRSPDVFISHSHQDVD